MNDTEFLHKISEIHNAAESDEHNKLVKSMARIRRDLEGSQTARLKFAISVASIDNKFGYNMKIIDVLERNNAFDPAGDFADSVLGIWNQNRDFYHTKAMECYTTFGGAYPVEWSDEDWAVLVDSENKGDIFVLAYHVDDEGYWVEPLSCDGRGSHSIT